PPATASRLAPAHASEPGAPPLDAAEIPLERFGQVARRVAAAAEPIEVDFVQDHRVGGDEPLPRQPVDLEDRYGSPIELRETVLDGVEAPHGAAIIVLVVAGQQAFGPP